LWPTDSTWDAIYTYEIEPNYNSTSSYEDFDVSGITLAQDGSYCVYLQTGWWEYFSPTDSWEKHMAPCVLCDYSIGYKWATMQIITPYLHPEVIYASDWLPHASYLGTPFCP